MININTYKKNTEEAVNPVSLYLIFEPLQLLQARELFKKNECRVLFLFFMAGQSFLDDIVELDDWNKIVRFQFLGTPLDLIRNKKLIDKNIRSLGKIDKLVISNYTNNAINYISNQTGTVNIILLEDGLITLVFKELLNYYKGLRFLAKWWFLKLLNIDVAPPKNFIAFSIFDDNEDYFCGAAISILKNSYSILRLKLNLGDSEQRQNQCYVILSNYIELGYLSESYYVGIVCSIVNHYKTENINCILAAHRFCNLEFWRKRAIELKCDLISPKEPIELYFIKNQINPCYVATTGSGATYSLDLIFNPNIRVFLPETKQFIHAKETIEKVHTHLQKQFTSVN